MTFRWLDVPLRETDSCEILNQTLWLFSKGISSCLEIFMHCSKLTSVDQVCGLFVPYECYERPSIKNLNLFNETTMPEVVALCRWHNCHEATSKLHLVWSSYRVSLNLSLHSESVEHKVHQSSCSLNFVDFGLLFMQDNLLEISCKASQLMSEKSVSSNGIIHIEQNIFTLWHSELLGNQRFWSWRNDLQQKFSLYRDSTNWIHSWPISLW